MNKGQMKYLNIQPTADMPNNKPDISMRSIVAAAGLCKDDDTER